MSGSGGQATSGQNSTKSPPMEVNGRLAQQAQLQLLKCGFTTLCGHRARPLTVRYDGDSLMVFCRGLGLAKVNVSCSKRESGLLEAGFPGSR